MVLAVKKLIKEYQIRPSRRLGQNFLVDEKIIKKVIQAANLQRQDLVLEIGPGLGALTGEIAKRVKKLIAIEKDKNLVKILKKTLNNFSNLEIIQGDILKISNFSGHLLKNIENGIPPTAGQSPVSKFKVVANLPFYITSPLIKKFLETSNPPQEMVLMVQKEIAQRICFPSHCLKDGKYRERDNSPKMNILAISVLFYAKAKIISYVSKKSFWPKPRVDSAIIKIIPQPTRFSAKTSFRDKFFKIVKAGFSQPRKQIIGNLTNKLKSNKEKIGHWLLKNNIQPSQRAETLTIEDWINLTKTAALIEINRA